MLLQIHLDMMETATIQQIHRMKLHGSSTERLPAIRKLSHSQGLTKACTFKEFRFEPPRAPKKRERRQRKLPPIPEHMLPRRHNSFDMDEEDEDDDRIPELHLLPALSVSPAFITERPDERSLSVEAGRRSPVVHLFNSREFTFPESSAKRKKRRVPVLPSIVPALTPKTRDLPLQAKIEKLAKQKRKDRAMKAVERRYEKKQHNIQDMPPANTHMAFRPRREPEHHRGNFQVKEQKQLPFKQMVRNEHDTEKSKSKIPPRMYTRIVDDIYSYTKGNSGGDTSRSLEQRGPYERIMVTPVTLREDASNKDELNRHTSLAYNSPVV